MNIIEEKYKWGGGFSNRLSTDYIALHHAEAARCTAQDIHNWHRSNGWTGIGYHFFVRKDGKVYRGRPINTLGAHVSGMNNYSIGICAEGDYQKQDKTMPQAQKSAIKELLSYLKGKYPKAKIVGHKEIGSSNCPGQYYPLDEMKNYKNMEDLTMTQYEELKKENQQLKAQIQALQPQIFDYVDENMPEWARPTILKLKNIGVLVGDEEGRLGLTMDALRILVMLDRAGLYK